MRSNSAAASAKMRALLHVIQPQLHPIIYGVLRAQGVCGEGEPDACRQHNDVTCLLRRGGGGGCNTRKTRHKRQEEHTFPLPPLQTINHVKRQVPCNFTPAFLRLEKEKMRKNERWFAGFVGNIRFVLCFFLSYVTTEYTTHVKLGANRDDSRLQGSREQWMHACTYIYLCMCVRVCVCV